MTIAHTEYDREAFLDEYSPLCGTAVSPRRNKIEYFRRRCFSELPTRTNNPISKLRHPTRHKSTKQNQMDRSVSATVKNDKEYRDSERDSEWGSERDSGYFSIAAEEQIDFSSFEKDMVPFLSDDDDLDNKETERIEKASSFVKRRAKFLLYKRNLKLSLGKEKQKSAKQTSPIRQQSCPTPIVSEETNEKNTPRSKKLIWRRALKQASMVVRFIRREPKNEDEMSLVREASIKRQQQICITDEHEPEHKSEESIDEFPKNNAKPAIVDKHSFEDSFVDEITGDSPLNSMYLPARNSTRNRFSRPRPRSLFSRSVSHLPGLAAANETGTSHNHNNDFIEKYLNRSKSLEDIFQLANDEEEHRDLFMDDDSPDTSQGLFPNDDFKPDCTVYCLPKDTFKSHTSKLNVKETLKRKQRKESLTKGEFETIIEEEVDNYILNDCQEIENVDNLSADDKEDFSSCGSIKHTSSLSYSVNDLYDLLNRNNLFNVEYGLDLLI